MVPLLPQFAYSLKDLYLSFSDANGTNFSMAFDTTDLLFSFSRCVAATVAHLSSHAGLTEGLVKGPLPPNTALQESDADENRALVVGDSAGIAFKAWEVSSSNTDSPLDILELVPDLPL